VKWIKINGVWSQKNEYTSYRNKKGRIQKNINFWGLDCLQNMTKYMYDNPNIFMNRTLYAHNGGKFDLNLAIEKSFIDSPYFIIEGGNCVELNGAWIGFTLRCKTNRKFKLFFRDSFRLLPKSLESLTEELDVKHKKLIETVSHDDINLNNYNSKKLKPIIDKYLKNDVLGLLEVVDKFGRQIYKNIDIDITKCYTGASLSKKNFFKNHYNQYKTPIYTLSDSKDSFIRKSYYGGRVECFKTDLIQKNYYYDFTSLYPYTGTFELPYGIPKLYKFMYSSLNKDIVNIISDYCNENIININDKIPKDFFGFVKCLVKTKNKYAIPKHCKIYNDKLIFPIFEKWTELTIFSEELDYDIYDYKFIAGIKFEKKPFMKEFFEKGFINKALEKQNNNPAMAQAWKIIINSGYGFWGLRTKNRDGITIHEASDDKYLKYLKTNKLISIQENKDYTFCRVLKDLTIKDFNVSVASAISSYARSRLHSLLSDIKKVGGELYYCDTDSVVCNINLNDYPNLKEKYQWDGDGSELGSLKNECDDELKNYLKKHFKNEWKTLLNDMIKKENGNLHFDYGYIAGCKQYALSKSFIINGETHKVEIIKMKGFSQKVARGGRKLKMTEIVKLCENPKYRITQKQMQFKIPKSNYVSNTNNFKIKKQYVNKNFRKIYNKGIIDKNGGVSPIII